MGNKFTQSVLQRLEQEQKVQTKAKPKTKTVEKKNDSVIKSITAEPVTESANEKTDMEPAGIIKDEIYEAEQVSTNIPDITEYLRLEPARMAKNKTFYLDVEVIDALCAAARRQKVTDSKLANDILRRVLGIGVNL